MVKMFIEESQACTLDENQGERMKAIGINGSPRTKWNTATLLEKALEGTASKGAETEIVHLYDLNYKGCVSCFACKIKGGKSYGRCAPKDDLTSILRNVEEADVLILASPIYFGTVPGEMRSVHGTAPLSLHDLY
jgi:multimeric flavodoxin WrbA